MSVGVVKKVIKQERKTGLVEVCQKGKYGRKRKRPFRDEAFLTHSAKKMFWDCVSYMGPGILVPI